ncbi:MAG TPA: CoA-binding protein [Acidobacteriota bacterium]|jgi:hypothetical protein|nr:CoA-binding protein [Acidobacteriota bacterium]
MDWQSNLVDDPDDVAKILREAKTIAVVGVKNSSYEAAFYVPEYLQQKGYRIIPVNPKLDRVFGKRCLRSLLEIDEPVDVVLVFRASENVMPHAQEALQLKPKVFWMQDGIRHAQAARMLAEAAIRVVQNRCMLRDHANLIG